MSIKTIPVVDMAPLLSGHDGPALAATTAALHAALRDVGFLYIVNHGVPEVLQETILTQAARFFAEDQAVKMQIAMKRAGRAWRGYFPVGGELTSGRPDQKEGIYFGAELGPDHPAVRRGLPLHGANLWPEAYPRLKDAVLAYMQHMVSLGQGLMSGIALALGLPKDYFRKRFTDQPTTLFRIFNYPRHVWQDEADEWGVREHTDYGFLTILRQDDSGGLEVKTRTGDWLAAPPLAGSFVINIGDMLEVWTQGIYRATPHRVRNAGTGDRLSLPFFFDPNWDASLEPIPRAMLPARELQDVSIEARRRWDGLDLSRLGPETRYGDFLWQKVAKVFPDLANP